MWVRVFNSLKSIPGPFQGAILWLAQAVLGVFQVLATGLVGMRKIALAPGQAKQQQQQQQAGAHGHAVAGWAPAAAPDETAQANVPQAAARPNRGKRQWCMCRFISASLRWLFMTPIHIVWGIFRAFVFAITGYFRPGPGGNSTQPVAQGYAEHPYAPWKGVFMGYVWELATVSRGKEPPTHVTPPPAPATAPPWPGYSPKDHFFMEFDIAAAGGDAAYASASVAARLGVTRKILQRAGKETRDRLTSELSTMMTVCTFIGGFIFTTLVTPAGGASNRTPIMLHSNLTSSITFHGNSSFFNSRGEANSTEAPAAGDSSGSSIDNDGSDAYRLLAGLTLIMATTCVGIYARLLVMLQWAATTTSLYRLIATWQRAMSGNQLLFFTVLTLSYASALAACWDRYGGKTHWVFMVLLGVTVVFWWFFANFWAQSIWSNDIGAMQRHSRLFHQRILGKDQGMFASACSLWAQKIPIEDVKYTFYGLLDQHLLGKNYPGP